MNVLTKTIMVPCMMALAMNVHAAQLILNEYNAVSSSNYLNGGDEFVDEDGNVPPPSDAFFGRVPGNGGDWFELVVIADSLDIRGWQLEISDDGVLQPRLVFSDAAVWANLSAGTIITVSEEVPDDVSYNPVAGDWWINVMAADTVNGGSGVYITDSDFPVSNDNWQLSIYDAVGNLVFGPAGEGIVDEQGVPLDVGVNSRETFALQSSPSALIERYSRYYNDAKSSSFGAENGVDGTLVQNFDALRQGLPVPDQDGDGIADDGNRSGVVGDANCSGGITEDCDDNCPKRQNADQLDTGGIASSGPDGVGDACQCGDVNNNGIVTALDALLVWKYATGVIPGLPALDKCNVDTDPDCNLLDAAVINRASRGLPPGISQTCVAAVGAGDESDLLYEPDRVLEIDITMDPAEWAELREQTQNPEDMKNDPGCGLEPWPSPYTWFSADITVDGQDFSNIGIRKKGFIGSLSVEKPAFKLDFNRFVAGQELNSQDRLTLNNAVQDPSFVKQCLSFSIFAAAGIPAPRCNFAQVSVNGEALGIYVNVEDADESFIARHFADATGKLFEAEISDFWPGWTGTWDPDSAAAEAGNEEIIDLANVLYQTPYPELLAAVESRVDIEQFITYWAVEAVVGHMDGYFYNMNNMFFYIDPDDGLMRFMPWDMDTDFVAPTGFIYRARSALARRLYNLDATRLLYLARVQDILDTVWDPAAYLVELNRVDTLLAPRLEELGMQEELQIMRERLNRIRVWINGRQAVVESELASAPPNVIDEQIDHWCETSMVREAQRIEDIGGRDIIY